MGNDIKINLDLTGEQRTNQGLKNTADGLDKTGKSAEKAGGGLNEMAREAGHLDKRIDELRRGAAALIAQFNVTGDVSLLKDIKAANKELGSFSRLRKQFTELAGDAASAGAEVGGKFGESLTKSLLALKGPALAGAIGVGVAIAPIIGAAISSAVVGGTGAGGLIGGIALAAQDQRVKDAASGLAQAAATGFQTAAIPFVAPLVEALHVLRAEAGDVASQLGRGFAALAPVLLPLTEGMSGLVQGLMPGLLKAMESAKPVLRSLAKELPAIGRALSQFLSDLAEDPDEALMGVKALTSAIINLIKFSGGLIDILGGIYEFTVRFGDSFRKAGLEIASFISILSPISGIYETITGSAKEGFQASVEAADKAKDSSRDFAGSLRAVGTSADFAQQELQELKDAINDLADRTMTLDEAMVRYAEALRSSREELKEGKRTLDLNTQAGIDNMNTVLGRINVIERMRDAEAESTLGLDVANQRYTERIKLLRDDLIAMGYNKKMVEEITARYLAVPEAKTIKLNLEAGGSAAAWAALRALERKEQAVIDARVSPVERRASGGPVEPHRLYQVNETGVEYLMTGSQGGYVLNSSQTRAMTSGATGGASTPIQVVVTVQPRTGAPDLERALVGALQATATAVGGGSLSNVTDRIGGGPL